MWEDPIVALLGDASHLGSGPGIYFAHLPPTPCTPLTALLALRGIVAQSGSSMEAWLNC